VDVQTIVTYGVIGIGIVLSFLLGRKIGKGNDGRGTVERIDDALTSAEGSVEHIDDTITTVVTELDTVQGEIASVSDAIGDDEQRLADSITEVDGLDAISKTGADGFSQIEEIIEELKKRHDNSHD